MARAPRFTQPSKVPGPTWIVPPSATALRAEGTVAHGSTCEHVGKLRSSPPLAGVCTYTSVGASAYDGTARRATPTTATPRDTTRRRTNMAGLPPEQGARTPRRTSVSLTGTVVSFGTPRPGRGCSAGRGHADQPGIRPALGYLSSMTTGPRPVDTVVLDVDGTLVDSNYHHTLAWKSRLPRARVRRPRVADPSRDRHGRRPAGLRRSPETRAEDEHGDHIRDSWEKRYDSVLDQVAPLPGAKQLLSLLRDRGFQVALASSGIPRHTRHAVDALSAGEAASTTTTSEDAECSTPDPELLEVARTESTPNRR